MLNQCQMYSFHDIDGLLHASFGIGHAVHLHGVGQVFDQNSAGERDIALKYVEMGSPVGWVNGRHIAVEFGHISTVTQPGFLEPAVCSNLAAGTIQITNTIGSISPVFIVVVLTRISTDIIQSTGIVK